MFTGIRRWLAVRRMRARIEATLDHYGTVEDMIISRAQDELAAMVTARRTSLEITQYRKKRAAAIKGGRHANPA